MATEGTTIGRKLNMGQTFYLREYPGNVYRKTSPGSAEFVEHRSNPAYRGCSIPIGDEQEVDLQPGIKEPRQPRLTFLVHNYAGVQVEQKPSADGRTLDIILKARHLCALCGATVQPSLELCEDCGGEPEDGSHLL
jgi:hypothetical protein